MNIKSITSPPAILLTMMLLLFAFMIFTALTTSRAKQITIDSLLDYADDIETLLNKKTMPEASFTGYEWLYGPDCRHSLCNIASEYQISTETTLQNDPPCYEIAVSTNLNLSEHDSAGRIKLASVEDSFLSPAWFYYKIADCVIEPLSLGTP